MGFVYVFPSVAASSTLLLSLFVDQRPNVLQGKHLVARSQEAQPLQTPQLRACGALTENSFRGTLICRLANRPWVCTPTGATIALTSLRLRDGPLGLLLPVLQPGGKKNISAPEAVQVRFGSGFLDFCL